MRDLLADTFDPRPYVGWASNMASSVRSGGVWLVPVNGTAYRFDHAAKRLTLVFGPEDDLFDRTRAVFALLGYQVVADPSRLRSGDLPPADHIL